MPARLGLRTIGGLSREGAHEPSRTGDLQCHEYLADPFANVRRTYEKFDLQLHPNVEVERTKIRRDQAYFDVPSEGWPF